MLRKDARVELLKKIPLFSECSKKDLREIARISDEVLVNEGTVLIREGESGHDLYVVVSGRLEVSREDGGTVAFIGPGEVAGEMALLSSRPRNATVTAVTGVPPPARRRPRLPRAPRPDPAPLAQGRAGTRRPRAGRRAARALLPRLASRRRARRPPLCCERSHQRSHDGAPARPRPARQTTSTGSTGPHGRSAGRARTPRISSRRRTPGCSPGRASCATRTTSATSCARCATPS